MKGYWIYGYFFKRPMPGLIQTHSLTLSSREGAKTTTESNWTVWHYGDRWATFSQTEVLEEIIVHFLKPPPMELADRYHIWVSVKVANTVCSTWWFPEIPHYPTCGLTRAVSIGFSMKNDPLWLILQNILKSLNQEASVLSVSHTPCYVGPGLAPVSTNVGSQFALTWLPPSSAQVAVSWRSFCISCWVVLSRE